MLCLCRTVMRTDLRFVWIALLLLGTWIFAAPGALRADAGPLDAEVLKKVKAATAYLEVKLHDGRVVQGSGFFTDEPGLLITNARVLHMLDGYSRKPVQVDVFIPDGPGKRRTLTAKVLGIDRSSDLALLRVEGDNLPAPLKLGKADTLKETQTLFLFGYPFGTDLGTEVTVGKSSVSKLTKVKVGDRERVSAIQLDGGVNPGNSGGPAVDETGDVVAVVLSGVRGTQIGKAIPAEFVGTFLNGRLSGMSIDVPVKEKDSDQLKLLVAVEMIDPLARIKKVELQVWTGDASDPRPGGTKEPEPRPGDSAKQRYDAKYGKDTKVWMEVPVPALPDAKQVYWVQAIITDGLGETRWISALAKKMQPPMERRPTTLTYKPAGGKQTAELFSSGGFKIRDEDGRDFSLTMALKTAITEQFAEPEGKIFPMRLTYDRFGLSMKIDDKPIRDAKEVQTILRDIGTLAANIEMDADGSMFSSTTDFSKVPQGSRSALDDVSDQVLESLDLLSIPVPAHKLEPGDNWKSRRNLHIGPGVMPVEAQGEFVYMYRGIQTRDGKEVILIRFESQLRGRAGAGRSLGGTVAGEAVLASETGVPTHVDATVKADLDFTFGRKAAKATGTLSLSVNRPAPPKDPQPEK